MDLKMKIVVTIAPFGIAGLVGFMYLQPAVSDYGDKTSNLDKKQQENKELTAKLTDHEKVKREKRELEAAIDALRGSVPRNPDMEILNIDLEKMALASGLDIMSLKLADKDLLKKAGLDDSASTTSSAASLAAGKAALASKVKGAADTAAAGATAAATAVASAGKGAHAAGVSTDAGLAKSTVQIKLMGDYKGLMTFVHKLETYQRVVAVSEVHATIPKSSVSKEKMQVELPDESDFSDSDVQGDTSKMTMSMLLTTYYLP
jgi:Tfp pilus assembly protein PilO